MLEREHKSPREDRDEYRRKETAGGEFKPEFVSHVIISREVVLVEENQWNTNFSNKKC